MDQEHVQRVRRVCRRGGPKQTQQRGQRGVDRHEPGMPYKGALGHASAYGQTKQQTVGGGTQALEVAGHGAHTQGSNPTTSCATQQSLIMSGHPASEPVGLPGAAYRPATPPVQPLLEPQQGQRAHPAPAATEPRCRMG